MIISDLLEILSFFRAHPQQPLSPIEVSTLLALPLDRTTAALEILASLTLLIHADHQTYQRRPDQPFSLS